MGMNEMQIREYDIVTEKRTGVRWVVTEVRGNGVLLVRRGEHGQIRNYLGHDEIEVTR